MSHISIAATLAALLAACGAPATPPQSPTNDVQPPATTTGDGKVIGATGSLLPTGNTHG